MAVDYQKIGIGAVALGIGVLGTLFASYLIGGCSSSEKEHKIKTIKLGKGYEAVKVEADNDYAFVIDKDTKKLRVVQYIDDKPFTQTKKHDKDGKPIENSLEFLVNGNVFELGSPTMTAGSVSIRRD